MYLQCVHCVADESQLNVEQLYVLGKLRIDFMYELHDYYSEVSNINIELLLLMLRIKSS